MVMTNIVFSIIIPHKNCPALLQRCLDSIPTRKDLEIIIVDNNSSPQIVDFNHFPGANRSDVNITRDTNSKGGGGARNTGLNHAHGKWIIFIDSDDYFNYSLSGLLDKYKDSEYDVIWFKINSVDSETYESRNVGEGINASIDNFIKGKPKGEAILRYGMFYPWGKMISKRFLDERRIRFEDSIVMNDVKFAYTLGYNANKIAVERIALLCIADRNNSVSKNWTQEAYLERIRIKTEAEMYYKSHSIPTSYLKYNNYLFFLKYCVSFPGSIGKAVSVMKHCGMKTYEIFGGLLIKVPIIVARRFFSKFS